MINRANINPKEQDLSNLIDNAIGCGGSFAIAILPDSDSPILFGFHDRASNEKMSFEVIPWLGKFHDRCIFYKDKTSNFSTLGNELKCDLQSTPRADYDSAVKNAIERCRNRNGKTVISRIICGNFNDNSLSIGEIAKSYFQAYPHTFRYIFYTPESGGWLAATPELLADIDLNSGEISTMAFAGTRMAGAADDWDSKNINENRFVVDYIVSRLKSLKISPNVKPAVNTTFGEVEHLCYNIIANDVNADIESIIDTLNPTPALCGYPFEDAVTDITELEKHSRECYGGVVALHDGNRYRAFVNLRCMQFTTKRYCIYAGGGITKDSVVGDEFLETESKTSFLRNIVTLTK